MSETFGRLIRQARVSKGLSQKDLAGQVKKENGESISAQYLNDIEHNRRQPPGPEFIKQLAQLLGLDEDGLMVAAGRLPDDIRKMTLQDPTWAGELLQAFRKRPT